jgi:hypothetical protein
MPGRDELGMKRLAPLAATLALLVPALAWAAPVSPNPAVTTGTTAKQCLAINATEATMTQPDNYTKIAPTTWYCDGAPVPAFVVTSDGIILDPSGNRIGQSLGIPHGAGHGASVLRFVTDSTSQLDPSTTVIWGWGGKYFDGTDRVAVGEPGSTYANQAWDCASNPPTDISFNDDSPACQKMVAAEPTA